MAAHAKVEVSASSSRLAAGLAAARSKVMRFAGSVARGVGAITSNSTVGNIIGNITSRGMDFATQGAREVMAFEKSLTRFGIAAGKTPEQLNSLRGEIANVSKETAISRDQIMGGVSAYVDLTGDADGATAAMRAFARVSQASGSSMDDVASAAASMQMSMGLDAGDIENVFSGLIMQGKAGAVTLKDMAGELSTLGPMMAKFKGGTGVDGIVKMGAAFQVVRQGAGSAAEANTQLQSMITGIVSHAKQFEKAGVKIYDRDPKTGVKTMKSFDQIIDNISNSKLMKDPTALGKAFGRTEALAAFNSLVKNRDLYKELLSTGKDFGAVQRDMDAFMQSSSGRMESAMNNLKLKVAEAFTPERIETFANAITVAVANLASMLDKVAAVMKWIESQDPKKQIQAAADAIAPEDREKVAKEMKSQERNAKSRRGGFLSAVGGLIGMGGLAQTEIGQEAAGHVVKITGTTGGAMDSDLITGKWQGGLADELMEPWRKGQGAGTVNADAMNATMKQVVEELKKLNAKPTTIVADGNQIAKTTKNATDNRRK